MTSVGPFTNQLDIYVRRSIRDDVVRASHMVMALPRVDPSRIISNNRWRIGRNQALKFLSDLYDDLLDPSLAIEGLFHSYVWFTEDGPEAAVCKFLPQRGPQGHDFFIEPVD